MTTKVLALLLSLAGLFCQGTGTAATNTAASTYYVSPSGSDSNSGLTVSAPFKTIQKACDTVSPGDTIDIMGGTYNQTFNITNSGSSSGYITIKNYDNQRVVIDGSKMDAACLIYLNNAQYIKIEGLELCNATGDWAAGIYVEGSGSHIQIVDNKIYHIDCDNPGEAGSNPILIAGTDSVTPISDLVIDGNQVYDCTVGWCEGISLDGNVSQWEITNNIIHDIGNIGIDAQGHWGTCADEETDQARYGLIADNTVYNCNSPNEDGTAAGIYIDGAATVTIERNTVYQTQHGIEVGCENDGYTADQITVRDNIIYHNSKGGIYIGGYSSEDAGSVTNSSVINNTCFENDTEYTETGELSVEKVDHLTVANNIFYSTDQNILMSNWFDSQETAHVTMNYNDWYCPGGINASQFVWLSEEYSFSGYRSASFQDQNSLFSKPLFLNETAFDFHPQASSPSINAGNPAYVIIDDEADLDGNLRISDGRIDCGALEYVTAD
ncbi:MAG: Parallel beta-helix repeat protein [Oscillospiraceae bacterium]|nr:Parallel beta-helix repeat protein [Oscillospiraceae bacterium]